MAIDVDILYCYTKRYDKEMKKRRHEEMKTWMILDEPTNPNLHITFNAFYKSGIFEFCFMTHVALHQGKLFDHQGEEAS